MTYLHNCFLGICLYLFLFGCNPTETKKEYFRFNKIKIPEGWFDNSPNDEILNRINIFGKKRLDSLLENSDLELKNFTEINYYTKYNLYDNENNYKSIPSIRVHLLKNYLGLNIQQLKKYYENSIPEWEKIGYKNVNIIESKFLSSLNTKGVEIKTTFDYINPYLNTIEKHRSRQYYFFISENYYLQISMNDTEDDKCDEVYDEILKSILIKSAQV